MPRQRVGKPSARWSPLPGAAAASSPPVLAPRDVKRAVAYLQANLQRSVPVVELAAQAAVSERTLHEHFRVFLGLPPSKFGVRLRLAAARRALQSPANRESVTEIGLAHGFSHLGRFAQSYRDAFGEPPSATRRAAAGKPASDTPLCAPPLRRDRPEIAIEAFAAAPASPALAEHLADTLAVALARDAAISVASTRAAAAGGRETTGRYALRLRLAQAGDRMRILAALIDVSGGAHLWGDGWDGAATSPLAAIDRVVTGVVRAVAPQIRRGEIARALRKRLDDSEAYDLCWRAYPLLAANAPSATREALDLLYRAIAREPDHALAAGLAACGHAQLVAQLGSTSAAAEMVRARTLAERAGLLDPDDEIVLTARSRVHTIAGEHDTADGLLARALARNPRLAWAWERRGWLRVWEGDAAGSIECIGRSLRLGTLACEKPVRFAGLAAGFFECGRYDLAVRWMRLALDLQPAAAWINRTLAVAYARLGERSWAERALAELRRYRPDVTVSAVVASMHFSPDFVARIANGLGDLGLPA